MEKKSGLVSVIGRPNVGKSTLMNMIVEQKVAITSDKPQTTRNRIRCIYTDEARGQIVFSDTPGVQKPRNSLGRYMEGVTDRAAKDCDVILWMIEPDQFVGTKDSMIASKLIDITVPVILVINKIDRIKKEQILPVIEAYKDLFPFKAIIPISAKTGEGVTELIDELFDALPYGEMFFPDDEITDQPIRQIVAEMIREKALKLLSEEIPHGIAVVIESFRDNENDGITDIDALIYCEKESHKGIIIGKGGSMIKKIGHDARLDIERLLENKVFLTLNVKVKKNWRQSDILIKNFGYKKEDEA